MLFHDYDKLNLSSRPRDHGTLLELPVSMHVNVLKRTFNENAEESATQPETRGILGDNLPSVKTATLLQESNNKKNKKKFKIKPESAVIVAAGNGTRLRKGKKQAPPKPLFKLGGLRLIERVLLTLKSRGIEKFRIVVGYRGNEIIRTLSRSRQLKKHNIKPEFVFCRDFQKGNGHSLACGVKNIDEPFLLTMADHVYDPKQVEQLLEAADKDPERVYLVTDPDPGRTFDLGDATKVKTDSRGMILDIGKELDDYSQVDTGLFYFPAGTSRQIIDEVACNKHSISDVVRGYIKRRLFSAVPVKDANWHDVDNEAMAKHAQDMLLQGLVKPTDGFVSKYINRKLSIPVTGLLVKFGVTPNMVTASVFILGLIAAGLVLFPQYLWMAGILWQLASVLDGTDGEISRLTWSGSRAGAWLDSICDAVRFILFYAALGIGLSLSTSSPVYVVGTIAYLVLSIISVILLVLHMKLNSNKAVFNTVSRELKNIPDSGKPWWQRWSLRLTPLFRFDVLSLLTMVLLLAGFAPVVFWISVFCVVLMSLNVFRLLRKKRPQAAFQLHHLPSWGRTLFSIVGLSMFCAALYFIPWQGVKSSIVQGGWWVFLVFLVPLGWYLMNSAGLHVLLGGTLPFKALLYNRLVGEALNASIPMANLGGEPFKVYHLSRYAAVERALPAVVSDKIINIAAGFILSGTLLILSNFVPHGIVHPLVRLMVPAGALALVFGILLALVLISPLLKAVFSSLLRLVRRDPREIPRVHPLVLLKALAWHLGGRVLLLAEFAGFLLLLTHEPPQAGTLIVLAGFTGFLGQIFFMIPQGLGVNEVGITAVMVLLGYTESLGMALAILRRGRMVFWAITGLGIFGLFQGISLMKKLSGALVPTMRNF